MESRPSRRDSSRPDSSRRDSSRRDEVLAGLRELFVTEGFLSFGVGDLAERLRCSRTTLYLVAPTKEQVVVQAVRSWFRDATAAVEAAVVTSDDPVERIELYLRAVARALEPASAQFFDDLAAFAPAGDIYRRNTEAAADRIRDLVAEGVAAGDLREVDEVFVGAVVAQVMTGIQRGEITRSTGLEAAAAYDQLAQLLIHGLRRR